MSETDLQNKITSADIPYVTENQFFLKENDWEIAKQRFIMFQPEHRILDEIKQKHEKLVAEITPLNARLENLKTEAKIRQEKQVQEFSALSNISKLKNLIFLLPDKYRNEAKNFINNYILQKETTQIFPWERNITLKQKLINFRYSKKLNRFKSEFDRLTKDFKDFSPRFDILKDRNTIADMLQEINTLSPKKEEIEKQQYEIAGQAGQIRIALDAKINILKRFFDKKLFQTPFNENLEEKDNFFEQMSVYSILWENIFHYIKRDNIHFVETSGLTKDGTLVVACYDKKNNRILFNKSFDVGEQLFYISEILLQIVKEKAKLNYNAKAIYQQNLCINADVIAKINIISHDFSSLYPTFEQCLNLNYLKEALAFSSGNSAEDAYSKAFVTALSSQTLLDRAKEDTKQNLIEKRTDSPNTEISLGEIISPYTKLGLSFISDNKTMQNLLEQIPAATMGELQSLADKFNDDSLKTLLPY